MEQEPSLETLAGGGVVEMFNHELKRALEDIRDPNTDQKKVREVILRVRIHPGEGSLRRVEIRCDPKLGQNRAVETHFMIGADAAGRVVAKEYNCKELPIFGTEQKPAGAGNVASLEERRGSK